MGRLRRGMRLMKTSWKILMKDKEILLFPFISMIISGLIILTFIVPLFLYTGFGISPAMMRGYDIYIYMFALYIPLYFVGTFFNTAVVGCADTRLKGKDPDFMYGLRIAGRNWYKIFLWALLASTVGIILQILRSKLKLIGRIAVSLIGIAWTYGTFFIVPVLIFEDRGVWASVKESASIFKDTWGESFTGSMGFGLIIFILAFAGLIPIGFLVIAGVIGWMIALVLAAVYVMFLFTLHSALNGIFVTALYHYAKEGELPGAFTRDMIPSAVSESRYGKWKGGGGGYKGKSSSDSFYDPSNRL
ncbi:MAG: DUF6159 family protein [Thermoplasmatota archaeon]